MNAGFTITPAGPVAPLSCGEPAGTLVSPSWIRFGFPAGKSPGLGAAPWPSR